MKSFDQVIVHTAAARARLKSYGIESKKINLVPHGFLMKAATPADENISAADPVTLLMFGQIKPYKGVDVLLRALAQLPDHVRQKCRARIVGQALVDVSRVTGDHREVADARQA